MGEKPVLFEKVKESNYPVVAGLVSSKELISGSLGIEKAQLLHKLSGAIEHPFVPDMVSDAACQQVVEANVDLYKLPIMRYTEKDGGK
jgi:2,5-furandicarboxylate decarboxylase 1